MNATKLKDQFDTGKTIATAKLASLTTNVRDIAANARGRLNDLSAEGRDFAQANYDRGEELARKSRASIDKAIFSSRSLVAERPLTAVAIGIAAGAVLGLLANRLANRNKDIEAEDSDQIYGG